jgi:Fe-S-cluster containining protein
MEKFSRNSPCPCGSGKKYKFCCSPSSINTLGDEIGLFKHNRDIAYKGEAGILRKQLCNDYMIKKQQIFAELSKKQNEIASSASGTITCRSGCNYCCILMVGATIQEVELIVHYLYQNEELFNYFIDIYPGWISRLREVDNLIREQTRYKNGSANNASDKKESQHHCNYLLSAFLAEKWQIKLENRILMVKEKLYCPFLREGACSIYEVRPYYCAGYIATTPCEWCNPLSSADYLKKKAYQTFEMPMVEDLSFYTGNLEKPVWSFMPIMVYDTLKYGSAALDKMKIIEGSSMKSYTSGKTKPGG